MSKEPNGKAQLAADEIMKAAKELQHASQEISKQSSGGGGGETASSDGKKQKKNNNGGARPKDTVLARVIDGLVFQAKNLFHQGVWLVDRNVHFMSRQASFLVHSFSWTNPIFWWNTVLGSSSIAFLLHGYAKYNTRYLSGKSDNAVLATVGSIVGFFSLNYYLSHKYYDRFEKKKRIDQP